MARKIGSHSEITGPRVRQAALTLFARHGYAAVSMRQIAAEVGVQAGALYNYTADKQALLFDLMQTHMKDLLVALDACSDTGNALRRLETFSRFHIRYHLDRPDLVFIAYMELRNLSDENFAAVEALRGRYEARLRDILTQGIDERAFSVPDVKVASMAIIAMLTGITTWYREEGRLSRAEVEEIYWQMVRKAVSA